MLKQAYCLVLFMLAMPVVVCGEAPEPAALSELFPPELVKFEVYEGNPIFAAGDKDSWDRQIRERGWIRKEGSLWRMYYTGYDSTEEGLRMLGYATSSDGIHWERAADNPIHSDRWVEDVCVVSHDGLYYLFAEGEPRSHWMTSTDGVKWTPQGELNIHNTKGERTRVGAATPCVFVDDDDGSWNLYYQNTGGVWYARGDGPEKWTNVIDEPVIHAGPEWYDSNKAATDQVFKHKGRYYMYYHGRGKKQIYETYLAVSEDKLNWQKYPGNPVIGNNYSSGITVHDGERFRMYTMHDAVRLFWSTPDAEENTAGELVFPPQTEPA